MSRISRRSWSGYLHLIVVARVVFFFKGDTKSLVLSSQKSFTHILGRPMSLQQVSLQVIAYRMVVLGSTRNRRSANYFPTFSSFSCMLNLFHDSRRNSLTARLTVVDTRNFSITSSLGLSHELVHLSKHYYFSDLIGDQWATRTGTQFRRKHLHTHSVSLETYKLF